MLSPGRVRVRDSELLERMLLELRDRQKTQVYPREYEEARRPLVTYLLSMTETPAVDEQEQTPAAPAPDVTDGHLALERACRALREQLSDRVTIAGTAKGGQHHSAAFCYASSFDRLTSRKPKPPTQPARLPMSTHLRNVLRVAAVLSIGALVYAWLGGGFPAISAGVRSFLQLPLKHDGSKDRTPAPVAKDSKKVSSRGDQWSEDASRSRVLYSNALIAFMPLK